MAKTLKLNVTFPMTVVINTETVASVEVSRKEARETLAKADETGEKIKGEAGAFLRLFASEITTEALLEILMRKGVRDVLRQELKSNLNNSESSVRVGDIKVAFEDRSVLARSCDCNACFECKIARGGSDE